MSLTRENAAVRIRRELREAEAQADSALLANTKLMETLLRSRQETGVEVHTGQKAIIRLARAMQAQIDATSDLFRVHDEMVKVGQEMDILIEPTPNSGMLEQDMARNTGMARAA